jgi:hypothetical protein
MGTYVANIVIRIANVNAGSLLPPPQRRALQNLDHLAGSVFNGYCGIDLGSLPPLLALPSVRSLQLECCHEGTFIWPEGLPKSNIRKVELLACTVTSAAVRGLAKGTEGPCLIRHEWGYRRHYFMPEPNGDWDYCDIPFAGAKEEDWVIRIAGEPEGDTPACDLESHWVEGRILAYIYRTLAATAIHMYFEY